MKPIDLYTGQCLTTLIQHTPVDKYCNRTVTAAVQIIEGLDNRSSNNRGPTVRWLNIYLCAAQRLVLEAL